MSGVVEELEELLPELEVPFEFVLLEGVVDDGVVDEGVEVSLLGGGVVSFAELLRVLLLQPANPNAKATTADAVMIFRFFVLM